MKRPPLEIADDHARGEQPHLRRAIRDAVVRHALGRQPSALDREIARQKRARAAMRARNGR
jgi:hypothetical protein